MYHCNVFSLIPFPGVLHATAFVGEDIPTHFLATSRVVF